MMYTLFVGEIPKGLIIRHICDHPDCINPNHLIPGTWNDNSKDKKEHGNIPTQLSKEQVYAILKSDETIQDIARRFEIKEERVRRIKTGRSWKKIYDIYQAEVNHKPKTKRMPDKPSLSNSDMKKKSKQKKIKLKPREIGAFLCTD